MSEELARRQGSISRTELKGVHWANATQRSARAVGGSSDVPAGQAATFMRQKQGGWTGTPARAGGGSSDVPAGQAATFMRQKQEALTGTSDRARARSRRCLISPASTFS